MKFLVTYEVESTDLNAATSWAHEMLYMANLEADSVSVKAKPGIGYTFAGGTPNFPEVNISVAQKIFDGRLPDNYTV